LRRLRFWITARFGSGLIGMVPKILYRNHVDNVREKAWNHGGKQGTCDHALEERRLYGSRSRCRALTVDGKILLIAAS
jgi:hypothetical protein